MNLLKMLGLARSPEPAGVDWEARFVLKHDPAEVKPELDRLAGELDRILAERDRAPSAGQTISIPADDSRYVALMNEQFQALGPLGQATKDGLQRWLKPNQPDSLLFALYSGLLDGITRLRNEFAGYVAPPGLADAGKYWTVFRDEIQSQAVAWPQRLRDAATTMNGDVATVDLSIRASAQPALDAVEVRLKQMQAELKARSR